VLCHHGGPRPFLWGSRLQTPESRAHERTPSLRRRAESKTTSRRRRAEQEVEPEVEQEVDLTVTPQVHGQNPAAHSAGDCRLKPRDTELLSGPPTAPILTLKTAQDRDERRRRAAAAAAAARRRRSGRPGTRRRPAPCSRPPCARSTGAMTPESSRAPSESAQRLGQPQTRTPAASCLTIKAL